jgi:hypothetical protein
MRFCDFACGLTWKTLRKLAPGTPKSQTNLAPLSKKLLRHSTNAQFHVGEANVQFQCLSSGGQVTGKLVNQALAIACRSRSFWIHVGCCCRQCSRRRRGRRDATLPSSILSSRNLRPVPTWRIWRARSDSNRQHPASKAGTLSS